MEEAKKLYLNHIPKTGGTSLMGLLHRPYPLASIFPPPCISLPHLQKDVIEDMYLRWASVFPQETGLVHFLHQHMLKTACESLTDISFEQFFAPYKLICTHANFRDVLPEDWHVITFLRDPVARLVSLYRHWQSWTCDEIDQEPAPETLRTIRKEIRTLSLGQVLQIDHPAIRMHCQNGMARCLIGHIPHKDGWKSPLEWSDEDLLDAAIRHLDAMLMVGITEQFESSVTLLQYVMAWPNDTDLQRLNKRQVVADEIPISPNDLEQAEKAVVVDRQIYTHGLALFQNRWSGLLEKVQGRFGDISSHSIKTYIDDQYGSSRRRRIGDDLSENKKSTTISMEHALWGTGWHERFVAIDTPVYRWSGPCRTSTIDLPEPPDPNVVIRLHLMPVGPLYMVNFERHADGTGTIRTWLSFRTLYGRYRNRRLFRRVNDWLQILLDGIKGTIEYAGFIDGFHVLEIHFQGPVHAKTAISRIKIKINQPLAPFDSSTRYGLSQAGIPVYKIEIGG
jgi:hypothetical protein